MKKALFTLLTLCLSINIASAQHGRFRSAEESQANLREKWDIEQRDNKGYVWTININGTYYQEISMLGAVEYSISLNMSHVGPTMGGVYSGHLHIGATDKLDGFDQLMGMIGGKVDRTKSPMCYNDFFYIEMTYPVSDMWNDIYQHWEKLFGEEGIYTGMNAFESNIVHDVVAGMFEDIPESLHRKKPFENLPREAVSWTFDYRPQYGTKSLYAKMNISNGYYTANAESTVSNLEEDVYTTTAKSHVKDFLGDVATGYYDAESACPMPMMIEVYPGNNVVFSLYAPHGSLFVPKFYGKIDRIPVEDTYQVTESLILKAKKDLVETCDPISVQKKAIADERAKYEAAQAAARKAAKANDSEDEEDEDDSELGLGETNSKAESNNKSLTNAVNNVKRLIKKK